MRKLIFLVVLAASPAWADRYAVVTNANGLVTNVIEAQPGFDPGEGSSLVKSDTANIGDSYSAGMFVPRVTVPIVTVKSFSFNQFIAFFTDAEKTAIVSSSDSNVKLFLLMAAGAQYIQVTDPRVSLGLDYLVSVSLLTSDREAVVKAAMQ